MPRLDIISSTLLPGYAWVALLYDMTNHRTKDDVKLIHDLKFMFVAILQAAHGHNRPQYDYSKFIYAYI